MLKIKRKKTFPKSVDETIQNNNNVRQHENFEISVSRAR